LKYLGAVEDLLARGSRRLRVKAKHRCPEEFMYSVVSGKRRKKFVLGHAVKVHGGYGGTAAIILNLLLDAGE
jgi:hypothetical protein